MEIETLKNRPEITTNKKLGKRYGAFRSLLTEISNRDIPTKVVSQINERIQRVNAFHGPLKELKKVLRKEKSGVIKVLEKELKIVPKGHYQNTWMAMGMSAFGIPMGVAFGAALDNMGLLGIGIPIGMGIGMAIGAAMDQKAAAEGRQLSIEV